MYFNSWLNRVSVSPAFIQHVPVHHGHFKTYCSAFGVFINELTQGVEAVEKKVRIDLSPQTGELRQGVIPQQLFFFQGVFAHFYPPDKGFHKTHDQ